ncbi:MAG: ABC transporter substrate-binding protein [Dethiobacter sp.]|nr:ABC transporter substrate-binding protein [Dethiobacter sp.]
MIKRDRFVVLILCIFLLSIIGTACGGRGGTVTTPQENAEPIVIGTIFPASGPMAVNGQMTFDGVDIAREMVNERGGINGRMVNFVSADAPDATAATQEAERLITTRNVKMIIGTQASGLSLAATAVSERNKVFYWEVEGIADGITDRGFKYVFRPTFRAKQMAEQMLDFTQNVVAERLGKAPKDLKVALVYEDSAFGSSSAANLTSLVDNYDFDFIMISSYSAQSVELSSLVLELRSHRPDVLMAVSFVNDSILLARESKELGFNPPVIIGTTASHGTADFASAMGDDVNGIFAAGITSGVNPDKMKPEVREIFDELVRRYKERRGIEPGVSVLNGFNGAWIFLTEVLPNVENIDADSVREAAFELNIDEGDTILGYGIRFIGPDKPHSGHNEQAFAAVMQWQDGKLKAVYPEIISITTPKF